MRYMSLSFYRSGDGLGILNSVVCMVHCLAMPALIIAGASFFRHPNIGPVVVITAYHGRMLLIGGPVLNAKSAIRTEATTPSIPEHMQR